MVDGLDLEALRRIAAKARRRVADNPPTPEPVGICTTEDEVDIGKVLDFKILPGPVDAPDTYEAFVRLPPFTIVRARGHKKGTPSCAKLVFSGRDTFKLACLSTIRRHGYEFTGNSLVSVSLVRHTSPATCPDRQADEVAAWAILDHGISVAKVPHTPTGGYYEWAVVRENK